MKGNHFLLFVSYCFLLSLEPANGADLDLGYGLPGTTQTISGYDTELGTDAMCWKSQGSLIESEASIAFPNPLVKDFRLNGRLQLLKSCPVGNAVVASAPKDFTEEKKLLRTEEWRNYTVSINLNTTSLTENGAIADRFFTSDYGPMIAVQIMACRVEVSGFCSPFKHEESNARLAAQNITQKIRQGDSHGGSHVHSGYRLIELPKEDGPIYEVQVEIPMIINNPGLYFPIAAVQLFFKDYFSIDTRYDIANAMPPDQRLLNYQAPPTILSVPTTVRIFAYCAIAGVASVICFLLFQCIKHRNHQILLLTQGHFIIVFLVASLLVTLSSFLLEPRNDVYCRLGAPLVLISAQLLYAVTFCRLWRINAVISPLLLRTLRQREGDTLFRRFASLFRSTTEKETKELRKKITAQSMVYRIILLSLPQVVIQVLYLILDAPQKSIEFNDDESVGRPFCLSKNNYLSFMGICVFGLLILILLNLAHHTRSLPSLFNETRDIFDSTLATLVIVLLGGGIKAVSNGATTSPAVDFLVGVGLALSCTLNTSVRIVLPKLRKIWRGETVLVSKLVSDHKVAVMKDDLLYRTKQRNRTGKNGQDDEWVDDSAKKAELTGELPHTATEEFHLKRIDSCSTHFCLDRDSSHTRPREQNHRILIREDEAPNRKLMLKMIKVQGRLRDINERIMAGMAVPKEDWASLRRLSTGLGSTFNTQVVFAWETPVLDELNGTSNWRDRTYSNDLSGYFGVNEDGETCDGSELGLNSIT